MRPYLVYLEQPAIPEYLVPLIYELRDRLGGRLRVAFGDQHQGTRSSPAMIAAANGVDSQWLRLIKIDPLPLRSSWFRTGFEREARRGDVVVLAGNPRILSNFAWLARPGIGRVWWGQGWGYNTTARSARIRLALANRFDVRMFYDKTEEPLVGRWAKSPSFYINNTIAYSALDQFVARPALRPHFCFIGRLTEKSGATRLPEIAECLQRIMGNGFQIGIIGDGPERASLQAGIAKLGLQQRFEFHGAIFDRNEASQLLQQYAFLLYPGAIGLATQHALSEGLPVITYRDLAKHGPEARLLEDGRNAILCDDTIESFAGACAHAALLDSTEYASLQAQCLQIRDSHSINKMADTFLAACEAALTDA